MRCYVCLSKTTERSYCYCRIPVHHKCLQQWKSTHLRCSVCKGIYWDVQGFYCLCLAAFFYIWLSDPPDA